MFPISRIISDLSNNLMKLLRIHEEVLRMNLNQIICTGCLYKFIFDSSYKHPVQTFNPSHIILDVTDLSWKSS